MEVYSPQNTSHLALSGCERVIDWFILARKLRKRRNLHALFLNLFSVCNA